MLNRILTSLMVVSTLALPTEAADDAERFIDLDGVQNTRDLGGMTTEDGRTIRAGQLIRSGEIDHISPIGKSTLDDMGVTNVVDLRTTAEAGKAPAEWPDGTGPDRHNFARLERETDLIDEMRNRIGDGSAEAEWMDQSFMDTFRYIPTDYPDAIRELFDVLLTQPEGTSVLYHCSGGKDRTGVTTALILAALGVPRDQIEADFLLSNVANDPDATAEAMATRINADKGTSMSSANIWPSLGVRPSYLDLFFDTLEAEYGGVENYLHDALGLSEDDLAKLKTRYLE